MRLGIGLVLLGALLGGLAVSAPASLPTTKTADLWSCPRQQDLTLAPGELLSQAVDLSLFGPFVAGQTLEDAARLQGKPEALFCSPQYAEWRYALYRTADAFVEVAWEPSSSSCSTYHRRTVYAYPVRDVWPLARVFRGSFLKRVQLPVTQTRFLVMEAGERQDRAWLLIHDGGVEMINWYQMPDGMSQPR